MDEIPVDPEFKRIVIAPWSVTGGNPSGSLVAGSDNCHWRIAPVKSASIRKPEADKSTSSSSARQYSSDDSESDVRHQIEEENTQLVEGDTGEVDRVKSLCRQMEPLAPEPIQPLVWKYEQKEPPVAPSS
jgi:hypothetical protein